ncbi:MAG: hypothetical protein RIS94_1797 [Pseudomonadota bacterium]|jgi:hypothetical protein
MLRFAPRYGRISPSLLPNWQVRAKRRSLRATNDNRALPAAATPWATSDGVLEAALRLFAQHGLSAAHRAAHEADIAREAGDIDKARWWLGVCRMLDKGVARRVKV